MLVIIDHLKVLAQGSIQRIFDDWRSEIPAGLHICSLISFINVFWIEAFLVKLSDHQLKGT